MSHPNPAVDGALAKTADPFIDKGLQKVQGYKKHREGQLGTILPDEVYRQLPDAKGHSQSVANNGAK